MKSIRQQLTLALLLGFTLLLGAGGAAIYFFTRATLRHEFDAALLSKALTIAAAIREESGETEFEFAEKIAPELHAPGRAEFYQVSRIGGAILRKSETLRDFNLPSEFGPLDSPKYFDTDLPGGVKARAIGLRFLPKTEEEHHMRHHREGNEHEEGEEDEEHHEHHRAASPAFEIGLVVAADTSALERPLNSLRAIVLGAGLLTLLATIAVVAFVLRRCLAPLNRLADQAASIDATSLQTRFPAQGMPVELEPICQRLNDLLTRLERSFNDLGEYAAKVAHDLRTPLAILRLKVEQAGVEMPPELAEELEAELHQLSHLVEQSLLIARAGQGRLAVQAQAFDLTPLVADAAEDFSLLAQQDGRRVRFEQSPPCEVTADPKFTRQIIHNLLSNALKHGHGDIQVKLSPTSKSCILTIYNPVLREATQSDQTSGLGLRVVETLLRLQPGSKCRRRRGRHYHAVRLSFPASRFPETQPALASYGG